MFMPMPPEIEISIALSKTQYQLLSDTDFQVQLAWDGLKAPLSARLSIIESWQNITKNKNGRFKGWLWTNDKGHIEKGQEILIRFVEPHLLGDCTTTARMRAELLKLRGAVMVAEVTKSALVQKKVSSKPVKK